MMKRAVVVTTVLIIFSSFILAGSTCQGSPPEDTQGAANAPPPEAGEPEEHPGEGEGEEAGKPPDTPPPGTGEEYREYYANGTPHEEACGKERAAREVQRGYYLWENAGIAEEYLSRYGYTGPEHAALSQDDMDGDGINDLTITAGAGLFEIVLSGAHGELLSFIINPTGSAVEVIPIGAPAMNGVIEIHGISFHENDLDFSLAIEEQDSGRYIELTLTFTASNQYFTINKEITFIDGLFHIEMCTEIIPADKTIDFSYSIEDNFRIGSTASDDWVAHALNVVVEVEPMTNLTVNEIFSPWVAVFDPVLHTAFGKIIVSSAYDRSLLEYKETTTTITSKFIGKGYMRVTQYYKAYQTSQPDATLYAGIMNTHAWSMDEIGFVHMKKNADAVASVWGTPAEINIEIKKQIAITGRLEVVVSGPPEEAGKLLRFVIPADEFNRSRLEVLFDGEPLPSDLVQIIVEGNVLIILVQIPYFSAHTITIQEAEVAREVVAEPLIKLATVLSIILALIIVAGASGALYKSRREEEFPEVHKIRKGKSAEPREREELKIEWEHDDQ